MCQFILCAKGPKNKRPPAPSRAPAAAAGAQCLQAQQNTEAVVPVVTILAVDGNEVGGTP
jgi:hypothetical protein